LAEVVVRVLHAISMVGVVVMAAAMVNGELPARTPDNDMTVAVTGVLRGRSGIVLIIPPYACRLRSELIHLLNTYDTIPGYEVVGIFLRVGETRGERKRVTRDFGVEFRWIAGTGSWEVLLERNQVPLPAVFLVRQGKMQAVLLDQQFERLERTLPVLLGVK
jgi:hypothetical protein